MTVPRLLFLSDTHLGFDLPQRPRITRRRRGHDFFTNFHSVLDCAVQHKVDGVVHGGDLFFRSRVPMSLVEKAFEPLLELARQGIPIFLVPGNHERSTIPATLFTQHANIHIFNRPCTFTLSAGDCRIALSGFPFVRHDVRTNFSTYLEQTGWRSECAEFKLLCLHQSIQGASVGPHNYTFRHGPDVIPIRAIPSGFDAILAGHIHRHQVLADDRPHHHSVGPVIYAGSTERTSFAEKDESKGFVVIDIAGADRDGRAPIRWKFHHLQTRKMFRIDMRTDGCSVEQMMRKIKNQLAVLPRDGIVQFNLVSPAHTLPPALSLDVVRAIAPPTMNVTVVSKRARGVHLDSPVRDHSVRHNQRHAVKPSSTS